MHEYVLQLIHSKEPVTIKLRGDIANIPGFGGFGPGELHSIEHHPGLVRMTCNVQTQHGTQVLDVELDFVFGISDILWVQPAFRAAKTQVITPGRA